jgi:two-component system, chemotaxis family, CheB/CheR fusion protein
MATLTLVVILTAFAAALIIYQRRFLQMHRTFADNLLAAHEEERAWVAREVHDDALQRVAMLVHELDEWPAASAPSSATNAVSDRIAALREEIEDLGVMLRRVAHRMHPALIDHAGLVPALKALAMDVTRASGIRVEVTDDSQTDGTAPPAGDRSLLVYRIAQEALRNVVKHAGVSQCDMLVALSAASIELRVTDRGKGFVADDSAKGRGLGLISMAERARLADGRLEVWSRPGDGTTVRALIPRQAH